MNLELSKVNLKMIIRNKDEIEVNLFKHLSPTAVGTILRNIPMEGRINKVDETFVYMLTPIKIGAERSRKKFEKGDISFIASNGAIGIFLKDMTVSKSMSLIGKIEVGIEIFNQISNGESISLVMDK
tara:strand:- start:37 stop:417 length:381 start_codon:yes stop_codon:yes gene_type:complete